MSTKTIENVERALGSLLGEDTIFIPCLLGCSAPSIVLPFLNADA